MSEWLMEPAGTAVLAFMTTLHCALALLRNHRATKATKLTVLPSIVFCAMPWVLSSPVWLIAQLAVHIAWFAACERFLPLPLAAPQPVPAAATQRPPRPKGFQPLRVLATFPETAEIRTFRFTRPEGFTFLPGQFVMVRAPAGGKPVVRCYSITSSPATSGYLEISVRNQGLVSSHLHETLRPGMTIEVNGPGGAFVYPSGTEPIVLLAGGIGITPLLGMLRHGLACEPARAITLILSAKTTAHVPFLDELRVMERRHAQFRLAIALSAGTTDPSCFSGRIDRSVIERVIPHPRECVYMLCGPLPMIEEMRRVLEAIGVPPARIHFEKFETATSLATASAPGVRLTLQKRKRTVEVKEGQTILDAVEAAGEPFDSMCRVGVCGTCRTRLLSGSVDGDFDAIEATDQNAGWILACVARPLGDCAIDA